MAVVTRAGRRRAGDAAVQPRFELAVVADARTRHAFVCGAECVRGDDAFESFVRALPENKGPRTVFLPRPRFTPSRAGRDMSLARAAAALSVSAVSAGAKRGGWFVYVVETKSGKLYSGITVNVKRRLEQHSGTRVGGAKALRGDPPVRLRYAETAADRSEATKREMVIKRMPRAKKIELVEARGADPRESNNGTFLANVVAAEDLAAMDPFAS